MQYLDVRVSQSKSKKLILRLGSGHKQTNFNIFCCCNNWQSYVFRENKEYFFLSQMTQN